MSRGRATTNQSFFAGEGVGHLADLGLPGRGYLNLSSLDVGIFDYRFGRKRLTPNICFPASTLHARDIRHATYGLELKDLEIMEANENRPKVLDFTVLIN